MSPGDGGASVDQLLDDGAAGLQYFERCLPILQRVSSGVRWTYADLCARYDQQRGLDLACLSADAKSVTDAAAAAAAEVDHQEEWTTALSRAWVDSAGEAAVADIRSDVTLARGVVTAMDQLGRALGQAGEDIRSVVSDKTTTVGQFDPNAAAPTAHGLIDGKTVPGVESIDALATIDPDIPIASSSILLAEVAAVLPAVRVPVTAPTTCGPVLPFGVEAGPSSPSDRDELAYAKTVCEDWLRNTFAPIVSAACQHVVDICASTDTAVRGLLSTVAAVAEGVDAEQFPPLGSASFVPDATPLQTAPASGSVVDTVEAQEDPPGVGHGASGSNSPVSSAPAAVGQGQDGAPSHSTNPNSALPNSALPGTTAPGGANSFPDGVPQKDIGTALDSMFGGMPTCDDLVAAIEKSGEELTERLKSVLDDALAGLTPPSPDAAEPSPHDGDGSERPAPPPGAATPLPPTEPAPPSPLLPAGPGAPSPLLPPGQLLPAGPGAPGPVDDAAERGHLDAALDGYSARIALAHNGSVSLQFGTPDGVGQHFELRPGPFGLPVVVQTETSQVPDSAVPDSAVPDSAVPDTAVPDSAVPDSAVPDTATPDIPAPVPSEVSVASEPTAPPQPAPPQPAAPVPSDSGAHLTEAGPL